MGNPEREILLRPSRPPRDTSLAPCDDAENERYLRAIMQTTADGFFITSADGRIIEVNDAYVRMSGYAPAELLKLGIADLDALASPLETAASLRRLAENGFGRFETRHQRKNGSLFDVEVSITYLPAEGGRFICFCRDISRRRQTDAILATRLLLLGMVSSHAVPDIHRAALDAAEQLTDSRIGFYHHFDEENGKLFLQSWSTRTARDYCRAEGGGTHYELQRAGVWADCIRQRRPVVHNDFPATPNQKGMPPGHAPVWRELVVPVFREERIVAVLGIGNKPVPYTEEDVAVVSTLADLSWDAAAHRIANEMLIRARDAAEEATRTKSEFLANISHEIRTPMTVVLAALEQLGEACTGSDQRLLIELAERSADRLVRLIDDVLDFSRIEAGKLKLTQEFFDLRQTVGDVVGLFILQAAEKKIDLRLEIAPDLPDALMGDPDRIGQVLINLLGNAFKFTFQGKIVVSVTPAPFDPTCVRFAVRDTGIGIPADKHDLIFESFRQADSSLVRLHGGVGLGLSISRSLVELMNGVMGMQSEEGCGSTFYMDLPLLPPSG